MIYPAEADIVKLVRSLVQGLQGYAIANEVTICFQSDMEQLAVEHHPYNLVQSLTQLICRMINLVPPQSMIYVRLKTSQKKNQLFLEVENTGIDLLVVKQISNDCNYSFTGNELTNGSLFRLSLPMKGTALSLKDSEVKNVSANNLPRFYVEVRKRLRSHFSQSDKLVAVLSTNRPQETTFLQKINALITANLEDEQFDYTALCKAMAMSRTQLFRRLKPLIQQAPAHYIKQIRLHKAKELLKTTDLSIGQVAFRTGFKTQSHFTKVFLEQYDVLPSAFRRVNNPATNE